ncbi:MAG: M42 family metallopeptidase [Bacillota bacterium]|nr:M42 family metallopeptidase [Bacillota bacterium]MDW7678415.1 M42 family metallopeptidase [Bacillota bacterium]
MIDVFKNDLKTLVNLISVSGSEQEIVKYIANRLAPVCDELEISTMGTVMARIQGSRPGKKVMVAAHMDEIGLIVKNISSDGFITFEKVGDFSDKVLPARRVWIQTREGRVPGVIGMRPAHIMTADDLKRVQSADELYIDVGAQSAEEVGAFGVTLGDSVVLQSDYMEMANPDIVCSRAIDNRIGCAVLLNLLENIDRDQFEGELIGVFSVLEETTIAGMIPVANQIQPDYVLALDTVPCGDVLDVDTAVELPVYMNRGPVLILAQGEPSMEKFARMHPRIVEGLKKTALEMGTGVQELVLCGKYYISDAVGMFLAGKGTPSGTLAIPRRYSHTPVEVMNIGDAVKTYDLLKAFLEQQNGNISLSFLDESE